MISGARLRRAVRRETVGVDVGAVVNLVGAVVKYLSLAFLVPAGVAFGYGESAWPFLLAGAITAVSGVLLERLSTGKERVATREGFLAVALTWALTPFFGCLPYVFSGEPQLSGLTDAYFESMSGFTTTGSSVVTTLETVPHGLLIWRQFTQWLGGMGIIVLALAILPRLRVGGRQLFESEVPGPEAERLAPSIRETARRLWVLYVASTALLLVLLVGYAYTGIDESMSFFDAVAHALSTLPTGGFSPRTESVAVFGAASQWTITAFMLVGATNFVLLYAAIVRRRGRALVRDEEFRLYLTIAAVASTALFVELTRAGLYEGEAALRHATFEAVSIMTTTGFASADFTAWTTLAAVGIVGLMFIGGSAGSTTGSVKVVRHLMIGKSLRRELDLAVHPEVVSPLRFSGRPVDEKTLRAVIAFVLLYFGIFAFGALLLTVDAAIQDRAITPFEAIAAAATTLGNVGPAFGFAGPYGSFDAFSDFSKGVMTVLMWLGRLEIIPVIVLLTRRYWRA